MSGDLAKLESENAFAEAKTSNRIVVLPEPNQLQIDIEIARRTYPSFILSPLPYFNSSTQ